MNGTALYRVSYQVEDVRYIYFTLESVFVWFLRHWLLQQELCGHTHGIFIDLRHHTVSRAELPLVKILKQIGVKLLQYLLIQ